eukprot:9436143-Pyramimonas_sp.AAC.1
MAQERPKAAHDGPQDALRTPQDVPRAPPRGAQEAKLVPIPPRNVNFFQIRLLAAHSVQDGPRGP